MPPIIPQTVTKPTVQTIESTIKAPLQDRRCYQRKKLTSQMPVTTARIQGNIYKAPHIANTRYKKTQTLKKDK